MLAVVVVTAVVLAVVLAIGSPSTVAVACSSLPAIFALVLGAMALQRSRDHT